MTWTAPLVIALALVLDGALGDPPNRFHPVAWLGSLVSALMRLAPGSGSIRQLTFGALLATSVIALAAFMGIVFERALAGAPTWLAIVVSAVVLDMTLALRGLGAAARALTDALRELDVTGAREKLAALCSRDATSLDETALVSGTIASLAENANDSVVAPLFYYALFGLPGALAFRAANTLDAMLGYRDHREYLGKASAHIDDVLGYLPARITAAMLFVAGIVLPTHARRGLETWWRDRARTPSPNGGHPMAMMAGLLGIVIEKPGAYVLGGDGRAATRDDVDRAFHVVVLACVTFGVLASLLSVVRHG